MTLRIATLSTIALFAAFGSAASSASDAALPCSRMASLECSFVRTQTFRGQTRTSQGRFYYDAATKSSCYDYRAPYLYRFIVTDTAVIGIDKKKNRGYVLSRGGDPRSFFDLHLSIDLFDQFLRCAGCDGVGAAGKVLGSVDSIVYRENKSAGNTDIVATKRGTDLPVVVESFDEDSIMYEQTKISYDKTNCRPARLIVRKKFGTAVTSDSLSLSGVIANQSIPPQTFAPPGDCVFGEGLSGFSTFGETKARNNQ